MKAVHITVMHLDSGASTGADSTVKIVFSQLLFGCTQSLFQ